jgi:hypothetical protein
VVRACALVVLAALAACGGGGSGESTTTLGGAPPTSSSTTAGTVAIGGPRIDAAVANQFYQYVPEMSDTSGAEVVFAIENKPSWATFDTGAGTLSGTPTGADVGSRGAVRISAVAGGSRATVEFQLQVVASADGVASVSLDAPVTRTDGTALQNLAGYRIYYGKTATRLDQFVDVKDRAATSAVVSQLTPGTWFFAATAYDANGFESEPTDLAQKQIG